MNYKTGDLALSAYLITLGFPVSSLEENPENKKYKLFVHRVMDINNSVFDEVLISFRTDAAMVNPQAYYNNIRYLKKAINEGLQDITE